MNIFPEIRQYIWDKGKPNAHPGVYIRGRGGKVFIPAEHLYQVADKLVDIAEMEEKK